MRNTKVLFFLLVFLGGVLLFNSAFAAQEETEEVNQTSAVADFLHRLEKNTSDIKSLQTDFVQEKKLAAFQNKIVIKGRIYLLRPDKIAWHVDEPIKYSVLITDKFMRQWDEDTDQVQEIPLSKNPMLRAVSDHLRGWFSGNYVSFLEDYDARMLQQNPPVLEFVPKAESVVKKIIQHIAICLQENERYLKWIKIQDVSGDNTTIAFENTILNAPIDSVLFEVDRGV